MYFWMYDASFFFNDTATTEIYPLSLHDALPISAGWGSPLPVQRAGGPHLLAHVAGAARLGPANRDQGAVAELQAGDDAGHDAAAGVEVGRPPVLRERLPVGVAADDHLMADRHPVHEALLELSHLDLGLGVAGAAQLLEPLAHVVAEPHRAVSHEVQIVVGDIGLMPAHDETL